MVLSAALVMTLALKSKSQLLIGLFQTRIQNHQRKRQNQTPNQVPKSWIMPK